MQIVIIDAPTNLGLQPTGVERLGAALKNVGLMSALDAAQGDAIIPSPYSSARNSRDEVLNEAGLREYALRQADAVGEVLDAGQMPLVLGGDDSILLGDTLALRRRGRYGLIFLDAHTDFYLPEQSETGEASDLDLALVTGRGPETLTNIDGLSPFVQDCDVALLASRDWEEKAQYGGPDPRDTGMRVETLEDMRARDLSSVADDAIAHVTNAGVEGFWVHLDADVLHDEDNPAVDYRLPDGLRFSELDELLHRLCTAEQFVGMDVSIFNPSLDADQLVAKKLCASIVQALT